MKNYLDDMLMAEIVYVPAIDLRILSHCFCIASVLMCLCSIPNCKYMNYVILEVCCVRTVCVTDCSVVKELPTSYQRQPERSFKVFWMSTA